MTPIEMDRDAETLQTYLACTSCTVDRCRHESVTESALWVFEKGTQIASVSFNEQTTSDYKWRASKMLRGQPVTDLPFKSLLEVASYIVRYC